MSIEIKPESVVVMAAGDVRQLIAAIRGVSDGSDRANIALIYAKASMLHVHAFFSLLGEDAAAPLSLTSGVHLRTAVELHLRSLWAGFSLSEEVLWHHLLNDSGAGGFEKLLRALEEAAARPELGPAERNTLETTIAIVGPLVGESWSVLCSHTHGGTRAFLASYNSFKQRPPLEHRDLLVMSLLGVRLAAHTGVFVSQVLSDQTGYDTAANVLVTWTNFAKNFSLEAWRLKRVELQLGTRAHS